MKNNIKDHRAVNIVLVCIQVISCFFTLDLYFETEDSNYLSISFVSLLFSLIGLGGAVTVNLSGILLGSLNILNGVTFLYLAFSF